MSSLRSLFQYTNNLMACEVRGMYGIYSLDRRFIVKKTQSIFTQTLTIEARRNSPGASAHLWQQAETLTRTFKLLDEPPQGTVTRLVVTNCLLFDPGVCIEAKASGGIEFRYGTTRCSSHIYSSRQDQEEETIVWQSLPDAGS